MFCVLHVRFLFILFLRARVCVRAAAAYLLHRGMWFNVDSCCWTTSLRGNSLLHGTEPLATELVKWVL